MVTFALKLESPPNIAVQINVIFLHILTFLVLIFIQVHQSVQGNHLFFQVIHSHSSYLVSVYLLYSCLVHFWIRHCDF